MAALIGKILGVVAAVFLAFFGISATSINLWEHEERKRQREMENDV